MLDLPQAVWKTSDAIDGVASLAIEDGPGVEIGGSGTGLLGFAFAQIGGTRHVEPVWTADCASHRLDPGKPMTSGIKKSGAVLSDQPDADYYRSFLADPLVHLPAGDWTISAVASFSEGHACLGQSHTMTATVQVHVLP